MMTRGCGVNDEQMLAVSAYLDVCDLYLAYGGRKLERENKEQYEEWIDRLVAARRTCYALGMTDVAINLQLARRFGVVWY